jgi:hypothetical protein
MRFVEVLDGDQATPRHVEHERIALVAEPHHRMPVRGLGVGQDVPSR